jgi:hypothetical protein
VDSLVREQLKGRYGGANATKLYAYPYLNEVRMQSA